jgi:hypothetical protein
MFFHPSTEFSVVTKVGAALFVGVTALTLWQATTMYVNDSGVVAGAVTSNASVEQNPFNSLNAQLEAKEATLRSQEIDLLTAQHERDKRIMTILFTVAGGLFVLILINFYLDFHRHQRHAWSN